MKPIKNIVIVVFLTFCAFIQPLAGQNKNEGDNNMRNPFGVLEFLQWNHQWNNFHYASIEELKKSVKLMKEAGVGWVRIDFLWADIEPAQGDFHFEKYDEIVDLLSSNNINLLGLLLYSTDWDSACKEWNCPPDNKLFANYAAKIIERYKDKVKYWEVWNEPDSATYWSDQDGLKSYCELLKEVYRAAKQIDPGCKILNGGLSGRLSSINLLYDNGAKDYFDILNIHIFESPVNPDSIKAILAYPKLVRKKMAFNGDAEKELWITEIGCPGVKRGQRVKNWWMGKNPTEKQQGEWVKKVYAGLLKQGLVDKVFWAFFRDTKNHWGNGTDHFGLVRSDFSKKPSFFSYQKEYLNWRKGK